MEHLKLIQRDNIAELIFDMKDSNANLLSACVLE